MSVKRLICLNVASTKNPMIISAGLANEEEIEEALAIASVALGACIIEKHFTLDRNLGDPDDSFSLELLT